MLKDLKSTFVYLDTNVLRETSLQSPELASLRLLAQTDYWKIVIPYFVYQEFLRFRTASILDEYEKGIRAFKQVNNKICNLQGDSKLFNAKLDIINTEYDSQMLKKETEQLIKKSLCSFDILDQFPAQSIFKMAFNKYFCRESIFEKPCNKPRNHIPDSIIIEEVLTHTAKKEDIFIIVKDNHLSRYLSKSIKHAKFFTSIESFLNDGIIKNEIVKAKSLLKGEANCEHLIAFFERVEIEAEQDIYSELSCSLVGKSISFNDQGLELNGNIVDTIPEKEKVQLDFSYWEYLGEGTIYLTGTYKICVECIMNIYYQDLPLLGLAPAINDEDKNIEIEYEKYIEGRFDLCIDMPHDVIVSTNLPREIKELKDWMSFAIKYNPNLSLEKLDIASIKSREEEFLEYL